jgi:hypothetical protein
VKLIRKLIAMWPAAAVLCAVMAIALAVTVSAQGSHRSQAKTVSAQTKTLSVQTLTPKAATPSAPCLAARQKVGTAVVDNKAEDVKEKADATKAGAAAADVNEDAKEKAAMKGLRDAVRTACPGQPATPPTAACLAAKKALADALTKEKAEDAGEKTTSTESSTADQAEDKLEAATLKPLMTAARSACKATTK